MDDYGTPSPLSLRALQIARYAEYRGIRGGLPGFARFRGRPEVDGYQADVGHPPAEDPAVEGIPWCIAAQYANHKAAELPGEVSQCPRTASTLHAAAKVPDHCKLPGPRPGAVGFLEHADGIHGHTVQCEVAYPDGSVVTIEGDTDPKMSGVGDQWCRHTWNPADGKRGKLLFWADLGIQPPAAPPAPETPPATDAP